MLSRFTKYPGHAEELARQSRSQNWDVVIAIGGDGTVSEVINGLLDVPTDDPDDNAHDILTVDPPALGIIPTGSANVFARALGYAPQADEAVSQLAAAMEARNTRSVPLGTWADSSEGSPSEHRWFAVNVGFGIDADVIKEMERRRAEGLSASPWRYMKVALETWSAGKESEAKIDVTATGPDEELEKKQLPLVFVSHTNPWTYLGPLPVRIVPDSRMEDGFSLFSLKSNEGWRPLMSCLGLVSDKIRAAFKDQMITMRAATDVKLRVEEPRGFQVDGEYKGEYSSVDLRFVPDAIEVLTPVSK